MHKRSQHELRRRRWLLVLVGVAGFATGAASMSGALATPASESPYAIVAQLARVLVLVENEYVDAVDRERLVEGAIKGMVSELDPHSSYLAEADYRTFQGDTKGEFGGVGVEVDFRNDVVTVIAPVEGSPAHRAGIRPGDRIVSIDKRSVRGKSMDELVKLMRGPPNSSVDVSVRRRDMPELLHFTLTREVIEVASVAFKRLVDDIAYLRIKQFQSGTHVEFLDALSQLRGQSSRSLAGVILDMRNNPGGLVSEAIAIADEFLDGELVYTTRKRDQVVSEVHSRKGGALTGVPVVVLVNEFSASASELVAGALQDNRRASVVGAPTFGKGSVQSIVDLPHGAGLRLTTLRYYTPAGHSIQAQGIHPDVVVEAAYAEDKSFGVVRERDLENHLPPEVGADTAPPPPVRATGPNTQEETGISPTHLGVARVVPDNPIGGPDFALSIGFQIVRGVLGVSR